MEKIEGKIIDDLGSQFYDQGVTNGTCPDLIPYACYYSDDAILTQNGELLQILHIPSFVTNTHSINFHQLRETLNRSISKNTTQNNISFWLQTVRSIADIIPKRQNYTEFVAKSFIDRWNKHHNWSKQFVNEIFITIVYNDEANTVSKTVDFIRAISFSLLKKSKLRDFEKMHKALSAITTGIQQDMENYGIKLLKIEKVEDIYWAKHLEFFSNIISGSTNPIKLPLYELSESLLQKKIAYGKNLIQIYDQKESFYAAIISIKYCNFLLLTQLDRIIQLNQEMILTQTISFIDPKTIRDDMMKYMEILAINEEPTIMNLSEIGNIISPDVDEDNRICITQVTIQIRAITKEILTQQVEKLFSITSKLGLVAVREEMFMPTLFWSQLPGNFNFIRRLHAIPFRNVGNFVSLYNFPTGKITGNRWGDAALILRSTLGTPYFFSCDTRGNTNTILIGPKTLKKTKYMNFILLSTRKQAKYLCYLDNTGRSKIFIHSLRGKYYQISRENSSMVLHINPFALPASIRDTNFIMEWLYHILQRHDDGMIQMDENSTKFDQEWKKLKVIIVRDLDKIKKIGDIRQLALQEKCSQIAASLNKWVDPNGYGFIFNNDDTIDIHANDVIGLNLNTIINNEEVKTAIFDYILFSLAAKADEKPAILAIDESWLLLDNSYFAPKIPKFLKLLHEKNIAVIMTTSGADSYETSKIQLSIRNVFPNQILLPNIKATIYQRKIFDISEEESRVLSVMKEENGTFMLKQNNNTVLVSIDSRFLTPEEQYLLCGSDLYCRIMIKAQQLAKTTDSQIWLPVMAKIIQEYQRIKLEKKLKEREKRQIQWEETKQRKENPNNR
jgi:type IV secretion system protein VirB4